MVEAGPWAVRLGLAGCSTAAVAAPARRTAPRLSPARVRNPRRPVRCFMSFLSIRNLLPVDATFAADGNALGCAAGKCHFNRALHVRLQVNGPPLACFLQCRR